MKFAVLFCALLAGCGPSYGTGYPCIQGSSGLNCAGKYAQDVVNLADVGKGATADASMPTSTDPVTAACTRWNADRKDLSEGTWSGSVKTCDAGDLSANGRTNALRQVNLVRYLAGLPEVTNDATLDAKAQACAMLMWANGSMSHTPPQTWKCWTQDAYDAASHANLFSGAAVQSALVYSIDGGANNTDSLGHRRWLLSNSLGPIGIGSTAQGPSCLWVIGGSGNAGKAWQAWPPPGVFPYAAHGDAYGDTVDKSGWSIQSDSLNLDKATVSVTESGVDMPVQTRSLASGYGSDSAIAFTPQGWTMAAGKTYHVVASGLPVEIANDVKVVDCTGL